MIILESQLKQIIAEEIVKIVLEDYRDDLQLLYEGTLTEAEFLKKIKSRLGRSAASIASKFLPYLLAGTIGVSSLFPAQAEAAPPPKDVAVHVQKAANPDFFDAFYKAYPEAADKEKRKSINDKLYKLSEKAKTNAKEYYDSDAIAGNAFVRMMQQWGKVPAELTPAQREEVKAKYNILKDNIKKIIDSTPVESIDQGVHSPYVYERMKPGHEESGGHPVAVYDLDKKKIIINPYAFKDKDGKINWTEVYNTLVEELGHARAERIFEDLGLPMSGMHKKTAEKLAIFASKAETGMSTERYKYLLSHPEWYAKTLRIKHILFEMQKEGKIEAFDDQGKINPTVLDSLIKGDSNALEKILKLDQNNKRDKELLEILQTLKPETLKQSKAYFDQLVKVYVPAKTSTQTA